MRVGARYKVLPCDGRIDDLETSLGTIYHLGEIRMFNNPQHAVRVVAARDTL